LIKRRKVVYRRLNENDKVRIQSGMYMTNNKRPRTKLGEHRISVRRELVVVFNMERAR